MHIHLFCQLANLIPYAIGLVCGAGAMYLAMQSPTNQRNTMFAGFGAFLRKAIAGGATAAVVYLVAQLAGFGITVPVEQSLALAALITTVVYGVVASFLSRFEWLDLEAFLAREESQRRVAGFMQKRGHFGDRL